MICAVIGINEMIINDDKSLQMIKKRQGFLPCFFVPFKIPIAEMARLFYNLWQGQNSMDRKEREALWI